MTLVDQVRTELERNPSAAHMREFYQFVVRDRVAIDYAMINTLFALLALRRSISRSQQMVQ